MASDGNRPPNPAEPCEGLSTGQRLTPEQAAERLRRRATFLRELVEAKELRDRVTPRRSKVARLRQALRMRAFRT